MLTTVHSLSNSHVLATKWLKDSHPRLDEDDDSYADIYNGYLDTYVIAGDFYNSILYDMKTKEILLMDSHLINNM